jgi:hypothetical protein
MLDRTAFANRLDAATIELFGLTERYCHNVLSPHIRSQQRFSIPDLRADHAGMDAVDREVLRERLRHDLDLLAAEDVVDLLYRDGRVPAYVNMSVLRALPDLTIVELLISRRLRYDQNRDHRVDRHPPFHPLVGIPPWQEDHASDAERWDVSWEWQQRQHRNLP